MLYSTSPKLLGALVMLLAGAVSAQSDETPAGRDSSQAIPSVEIGYDSKGWEFRTKDDRFLLQFQSRLQFRYAYAADADPLSLDDFDSAGEVFEVNRARLKIGGHAYRPWMHYYWEYELQSGNLLDFRIMLERYSWLQLKVGQWKIHFNRERIISSGKQQMSDRSLINRPFTIDRQQGASLYGRLRGGGLADFNYWFSVLTGTGRASQTNDDGHLMYMARTQWNFFGRAVRFEGSDTRRHSEPVGLIAVAAVTNRSPYTRFSQSGGGDLEGFEPGEAGQYRVNQAVVETAVLYRGLSWQQELHWKEVDDRKNGRITTLAGNYAQLGYFVHGLFEALPPQLEVALRHSIFDPDRSSAADRQQEYSGAANWFFSGHLNKLTLELTHFQFEVPGEADRSDLRVRVQWDVSI